MRSWMPSTSHTTKFSSTITLFRSCYLAPQPRFPAGPLRFDRGPPVTTLARRGPLIDSHASPCPPHEPQVRCPGSLSWTGRSAPDRRHSIAGPPSHPLLNPYLKLVHSPVYRFPQSSMQEQTRRAYDPLSTAARTQRRLTIPPQYLPLPRAAPS